jgi:hypothetical protein
VWGSRINKQGRAQGKRLYGVFVTVFSFGAVQCSAVQCSAVQCSASFLQEVEVVESDAWRQRADLHSLVTHNTLRMRSTHNTLRMRSAHTAHARSQSARIFYCFDRSSIECFNRDRYRPSSVCAGLAPTSPSALLYCYQRIHTVS